MSFLAPLLEAQDLDRAADAARKRSEELAARARRPKAIERINRALAAVTDAENRRIEIEGQEEALGGKVAEIVRAIEVAEVERYSGKRSNRDDAASHESSQQALRDEKSALEEEEMALLEALESAEKKIAASQAEVETHRESLAQVEAEIAEVEAEVAAEIERLGSARALLVEKIPAKVVTAYERVRAQPRSGGRGACALEDGRCVGCRIQLPSLERKKMMDEPEEAVIQCPQCRRVLVR